MGIIDWFIHSIADCLINYKSGGLEDVEEGKMGREQRILVVITDGSLCCSCQKKKKKKHRWSRDDTIALETGFFRSGGWLALRRKKYD